MNKFKIGDRVLVNMNPQNPSEKLREGQKRLAKTISQFEHKSAEITSVYNECVYELNGKYFAVEDILLPAADEKEEQTDDTITISRDDFLDACAEFIAESPLNGENSGDMKTVALRIVATLVCASLTRKLFGENGG